MARTRAKLFEGDDTLDLAAFKPKTEPDRDAPPPDQVKAVSEAASFRSRESATSDRAAAKAEPPRRPRRTYRTGRSVQFNIKASQAVVDAFYRLSDEQGWVLGETLAYALSALERDLLQQNPPEPDPVKKP